MKLDSISWKALNSNQLTSREILGKKYQRVKGIVKYFMHDNSVTK